MLLRLLNEIHSPLQSISSTPIIHNLIRRKRISWLRICCCRIRSRSIHYILRRPGTQRILCFKHQEAATPQYIIYRHFRRNTPKPIHPLHYCTLYYYYQPSRTRSSRPFEIASPSTTRLYNSKVKPTIAGRIASQSLPTTKGEETTNRRSEALAYLLIESYAASQLTLLHNNSNRTPRPNLNVLRDESTDPPPFSPNPRR